MKTSYRLIVAASLLLASMSAFAQAGDSPRKEEIMLQIRQDPAVPYYVDECMSGISELKNGQRGLLGTAVDFVANLSSKALFSIFDKVKASRVSEWKVPVTKDYFYNSVSFLGPYDPSGLQFRGIQMSRNMVQDDSRNSVFHLECSMPTDSVSLTNFLANSRFVLELDSLAIDLSKVKARYTAKKKISIEIDIAFKATWVDESLTVHKDQELGMFRISLPSLKYDPSNPVRTFGKADGVHINGVCFFIPRSYAAYVEDVEYEPGMFRREYRNFWSAAEFEVGMTVKESTAKPRSAGSEFTYEYFQKALPNSLQQIATNQKIVGPAVVNVIKNY